MIDLVYAHPYPDRSIANRVLLDAVREIDDVRVASLYDLYPDFVIDVEAEQAALTASDLVIWQHPLYWYGVPALLKQWFDKVLAAGWAYGEGGTALHGKTVLWAVTSGGDDHAFSEIGIHGHEFARFVPPILQTARFCGMHFAKPFVVHGAHKQRRESLEAAAGTYRDRVTQLVKEIRG